MFYGSGGLRTTMNLRQLAALADQGWTNLRPRALMKLPKVGSKPLYIAFVMTLVGT
jgi:hypothetical protein